MLIKVCGITEKTDASKLKGKVDILGFIFYPPSQRNAFNLDKEIIKKYGKDFQTVGVFVDSPLEEVTSICEERDITTIQLHGKENLEYIELLKKKGYKIIKAISISTEDDVTLLQNKINLYQRKADILLFDTAGRKKGGNGYKFDWNIFKKLIIRSPFFLSGGISIEDVKSINEISKKSSVMIGVDINSRFEISPGEKDINQINEFTVKIIGRE